MRKIINTLLAVIVTGILLPHLVLMVQAAEEKEKFTFELSVDGKDTKEVEPGDVITVVLRLKRTDASEEYTMYAMQDEIRYDSTFLELVEGSAVLSDGISSTDIAMVDRYREFYMNYLSMSGGEKWKAETLIGSFQLRVVGESGVTKITNEDFLVSLKDGSGSYPCEANELTIILSTDCVVTFRTNGGSELNDITVQFGEKISKPENPEREGFVFAGWYKDIHLTEEWDFAKDIVQGNISLYAKWNVSDSVSAGDDSHMIVWCFIVISLILIWLMLWYRRRKKTSK